MIDLDGPLADLRDRIKQLQATMVAIEISSKSIPKNPVNRGGIDLSVLGPTSINTTNSMCIVFLASSFEEFYREAIAQCGLHLASVYSKVDESIKINLRSHYLSICMDKMRSSKRILTSGKPKAIDHQALSQARAILETATKFPISEDPSGLESHYLHYHANNFRPHVVDEIAQRIGISSIVDKASESTKIKSHFGETRKQVTSQKLRLKLNTFYESRNKIVHSLSGSSGYAIEYVFDYFNLIDIFCGIIKRYIEKSHHYVEIKNMPKIHNNVRKYCVVKLNQLWKDSIW